MEKYETFKKELKQILLDQAEKSPIYFDRISGRAELIGKPIKYIIFDIDDLEYLFKFVSNYIEKNREETDIDEPTGKSGLPRLSGDYNKGYTRAIQDIQEVFEYIQSDLKYHHKGFTGKLAVKLLQCCLENRGKLRDKWAGFIRFNGQKNEFEWF